MRGGEPEEDPPHHQAQPVAVPPAPARTPAPGPGLGVARHAAERAMGDRYDASLLRPRRLVSPDGDHRLLRPDDRRLAALAVRHGNRRGGGPRRGAAQPADQPGRPRAGAQIRQRPRLRREGLREGGAALRRRAGVHYALYPTAERDDRALLPDAEAGVRVAASLREPRPRVSGGRGMARSLRCRTAALGAGISDAEGVPGALSGLSCTKTRGTPQSAVFYFRRLARFQPQPGRRQDL